MSRPPDQGRPLRTIVGLAVAGLAIVTLVVLLRDDETRRSSPVAPSADPAPVAAVVDRSSIPEPSVAPRVPHRVVRVTTNVPGATVELGWILVGGMPEPLPVTKTSGKDGEAIFDLPIPDAPVAYLIAEARAEGKIPASVVVNKSEVRLTLREGFVVRGRVVGPGREPVAGATLSGAMGTTVRSGEDGSFELLADRQGWNLLRIRHRSYQEKKIELLLPTEELVIALSPGRSLRGRVTFPDGRPVAGIRVFAGGQAAVTDEDGRYELAGLADGEIAVMCPALESAKLLPSEGELDLVADFHVIRVRVRDAEGRPVRRASIRFTHRPAPEQQQNHLGEVTGLSGDVVSGQPGGTILSVSVGAKGHVPELVEIPLTGPLQDHLVEVVLRRIIHDASLAIQARGKSGRSLDELGVELRDSADWPIAYRTVSLDRNGRGVVGGLPPGSYLARFTPPRNAEHFLLSKETGVVLEAGQTATTTVQLPLGGRIRLRVLRVDGSEDLAAEVRIRQLDGPWMQFGFTSDPYLFELSLGGGERVTDPPFEPGLYVIDLVRMGKPPVSEAVRVDPGEFTDVDLHLPD